MARQKGSGFIPGLNTLLLALCSSPCTGKVMLHVIFSRLVDETNWALRLLLCLKCKTEIESENMAGLSKSTNKNYASDFLEYYKDGWIISKT